MAKANRNTIRDLPYRLIRSKLRPQLYVDTRGVIWTKSGKGNFVPAPIDWKLRYPKVSVRGARLPVHIIVATAFYGPCPRGLQCRHLNDDRRDNRPENLMWGTAKENTADHIRNNGGVHSSAIVKRGHRQIRQNALDLIRDGVPYDEVAKRMGISYRTACRWREKFLPDIRHKNGKLKKGETTRPVICADLLPQNEGHVKSE